MDKGWRAPAIMEEIGMLLEGAGVRVVVMQQAFVVTGSLTDSRTVCLDEPIPLSGGKVRVIVEVAEMTRKMSHNEFLAWLRERHEARGHVPRTREEVDASLRAERESWDD
jgi:hypothetical protein